jgi:hypothetical protein
LKGRIGLPTASGEKRDGFVISARVAMDPDKAVSQMPHSRNERSSRDKPWNIPVTLTQAGQSYYPTSAFRRAHWFEQDPCHAAVGSRPGSDLEAWGAGKHDKVNPSATKAGATSWEKASCDISSNSHRSR